MLGGVTADAMLIAASYGAAEGINFLELKSAAKHWGAAGGRTPMQNMMHHFNKHIVGDGKLAVAKNPIKFTKDAVRLWKTSASSGKLMSSGAIKIKLSSGMGGFYTPNGKILSFFYT
jgi:hypothetical protein